MVLSLLMPFATPLNVFANEPPPTGGLGTGMGVAHQGILRATFDAMLLPGMGGRPDYMSDNNIAPDGSVMLNWPMTTPPGGSEFLDVLRFYDEFGRRHELSVRSIHGDVGRGVMVNYDVFIPIDETGAGVRYMHISDPLRRGQGYGAPGFQIFVPGPNIFEHARYFFVTNDRNYPMVDTYSTTRLNRVNDRPRFDVTDTDPTRDFTRLHPRYPNNWNSGTFTGMVQNPAWPGSPPDPTIPQYIEGDTGLDFFPPYVNTPYVPLFDTMHYNWLSPSFNIEEGHGYSFRFDNRTLHFRWENGQFFFFIEDILGMGIIHDFTLERYAGTNIDLYVRSVGAVPPPSLLHTNVNPALPNTMGRVYVLAGIDMDHMAAIPFAHNDGAANPALPNTNPGLLGGFYDQQSDPAIFPVVASHLTAPYPLFDTGNLNMRDEPPIASPAEPVMGLDIRFNLPSFFNEDTREFNRAVVEHPVGERLGVVLSIHVGGAQTPEDFEIRFPLGNMPVYTAGGNAGFGVGGWEATLIPRESRTFAVDETPFEIELMDASRLMRLNETVADRARLQIGGLRPSIAYENSMIAFGPYDAVAGDVSNFLSRASSPIATYTNPFYTFLDFRFDRLLGREVIIAEPFNFHIAQLGRGHNVRIGYYELVSTHPYPGWQPVAVNAAMTDVYFSIPGVIIGEWVFGIRQTQTFPLVGNPPRLLSQNVVWAPNREPGIDIPTNFTVDNVRHRPMREPAMNFDIYQAGHLEFTAQWNIAPFTREIMPRLGRNVTYPLDADRYGNANDVLRVTYIIGHSTSPETEAMVAGGETAHREYIRVEMEIRRVFDEFGNLRTDALEVRYLDTSDFVPARYPGTPHPIANRYSEVGWITVIPRPDPSLGESVLYASVDIVTNSVRRHRYPPPPDYMRDDFQFAGVYFMNVRLENWGVVGSTHNLGERSPWSLFDYIVVEDFPELDPPPPANLTVEAGPQAGTTTQPYLNVSYGIPASALLTYLNTQYPMETQITTNLYIGRFEAALMDTFFPYSTAAEPLRRPLEAELRSLPANAYSIDFLDPRLDATFVNNRTELNLGDPVLQNILRGEIGATPQSGVVRITNIPLIAHDQFIATPSGITFNAGDIINFPAGADVEEMDASFRVTNDIINYGADLVINLRLINMDENTVYFVFSDLEIEKWDELSPFDWELMPIVENPAISTLTGVVSDTTVGTPDRPGPGEVGPPAPELNVRDVEQMAATIYWAPIELTPQEEEGENEIIRTEWEIIRILDGERMTTDQMNTRNRNFAEVFAGLVDSPRRKGWITDGSGFTVVTLDGAGNVAEEEIIAPNEGTRYLYNPSEVSLRDITLHPNNLYFYYVRTVRIEEAWDDQLQDYVLVRSVSTWSEVTVTTRTIPPPIYLRQEDPGDHWGFDEQTMARISWVHPNMELVLQGIGTYFLFQYQVWRQDPESTDEGAGRWDDVQTIPAYLMTEYMLDQFNPLRMHYILTGLDPGSMHQVRVRLYDVVTSDQSLWSNTIIIFTEAEDEDGPGYGPWIDYLRRRLEEILRQPFWTVQRTPTTSILVYRPADVFQGHMEGSAGPIPLHNTGANRVVYYLPTSIILTANENNRGFVTAHPEMEFQFAPSFLNPSTNEALATMLRSIDVRGSELTDSFVRMEIDRTTLEEINGVPSITPRTALTMELVGTNDNTRNIVTWDAHMYNRARRIVENWLTDPFVLEGIREQLRNELSNEDISDHLYHVVSRVEAEIIRATSEYINTREGGILTNHRYQITDFDSAVHVTATRVTENMYVSGHRLVNNNWQPQNLIEYHHGRSFLTRAPGTFAFVGRVVDIPYIYVTPGGDIITTIVARYGLEDLFGVNVDLHQNANRQMVVGSIARMAGVPRGADAFGWANRYLNVEMSSRNALGLISRQEAIAVTMALYEHRTNMPIATMRINNFQQTAGMNLDPRYAQAVRGAFELGIVSEDFDPAGAITIGEFLDMLRLMSARVRV